MKFRYTLFIKGGDRDAHNIVPLCFAWIGKTSHYMGGFCDINTRLTTWTFTHKTDRDDVKNLLLKWADKHGTKIIEA